MAIKTIRSGVPENCRTAEAGIEQSPAEGRDCHGRPPELNPTESEACLAGADAVERMRRRMGTSEGKTVYSIRKVTAEAVFGEIKEARGFRPFSMRFHAAACFEWRLACTSWNLKQLHARSMSAA